MGLVRNDLETIFIRMLGGCLSYNSRMGSVARIFPDGSQTLLWPASGEVCATQPVRPSLGQKSDAEKALASLLAQFPNMFQQLTPEVAKHQVGARS